MGRKKKEEEVPEKRPSLKSETKHGVLAVIAFAFALFFTLAALGNAGVAGRVLFSLLEQAFGFGYYLLPVLSVMTGVVLLREEQPQVPTLHTVSVIILFLSSLGLLEVIADDAGGVAGTIVSYPFIRLFDIYIGTIFLVTLLLISLFILFDTKPSLAPLKALFKKKEVPDFDPEKEPQVVNPLAVDTAPTEEAPAPKTVAKKVVVEEEEEFIPKKGKDVKYGNYTPPSLSLLESDRGKANVGDVKGNANIIKRTLLNFGIEVEMDEITIGPTFTRYALKPAVGVKLSRIVGLQNDLALALAAHPVRIEAPIPGKSLVGIEVPNKTKATVGLGSLLSDERFQKSPKPLTVAVGRDVSGTPHFANIAKMPHAIIAGTTGSGKSVAIHALITSLLYRNSPEKLRFIMVDPKRVELTLYNKIPHLLTPVITDAKKAILALKWAAKEMERRYDVLQAEAVRDIDSYHSTIVKGGNDDVDQMPYIIIIIDELADIMQAYPRELEAAIVRLAQMSRAVGIHLILSTQRPDVNVITGLIKANVPTRIALRVPTQIDSRTILDTGGAEKLLGQGDMLYSGGEGQPARLQSAYISEDEVKKVVQALAAAYQDELIETIELEGSIGTDKSIFESSVEGDGDDDLYEDARMIVIEQQKASTSFLQRKLGVGYARAARLIDMLEERGVVGPGNGAKPRDVLEKAVTTTYE